MIELLYLPFVGMMAFPGAALLPGLVLGIAAWLRKHRLTPRTRRFVVIVILLWLVYGVYETVMHFWMQSVIAPIRIDLLLIAPVLTVLTLVAVLGLFAGAKRSAP